VHLIFDLTFSLFLFKKYFGYETNKFILSFAASDSVAAAVVWHIITLPQSWGLQCCKGIEVPSKSPLPTLAFIVTQMHK